MSEGHFAFFSRAAIDAIDLPPPDRNALWPLFDQYRDSFVALRANCHPDNPLQLDIEQVTPSPTIS